MGQRYPRYLTPSDRDIYPRLSKIPVYLCDAEFEGQVEFSHCKFEKALNLSGAIFRKEVLFRDTILNDKFYPRGTKFCGNVNFRKTEFTDADFHDTVFKDKANFRWSTFCNKKSKTRFLNAKFQDRVNFVDTKFHNQTEFVGTTFNEAFFSEEVNFDDRTEFKYVVFENGEKIIFVTKNLSNVSFINTDITKVRFSDNAIWGELAEKPAEDKFKILHDRELEDFFKKSKYWFCWGKVPDEKTHNDKLIMHLDKLLYLNLLDDKNLKPDKSSSDDTINIYSKSAEVLIEIKLFKDQLMVELDYYGNIKDKEKKPSKKKTFEFLVKKLKNMYYVSASQLTSLDSIKAEYRNLRENYEHRLRYDEAGKFFIREMELKRNYREHLAVSRLKHNPIDVLHKLRMPKRTNFNEAPRNEYGVEQNNLIQHYGIEQNNPLMRCFSLTGLYHYLFLYGESIKGPFFTLVLPFFILPILYWSLSQAVSHSSHVLVPLGNATNRTLLDIFQGQTKETQLADYIIKVLTIPILGTFLIPLRRRLERKFTR